MVHASPAYHEAYLGAREEVLHVITTHILHQNGIGLLDPWTAVHAPQLGYDIHNRTEIITDFLERYHQGRMEGNPRRLALQDSLAILNLQSRIAFLISEYCKAMFAKHPLTRSKDKGSLSPSQPELKRLHRAHWRYIICSRLFALTTWDHHLSVGNDASAVDEEYPTALKFLGLFPIHEVEELACLHREDCIDAMVFRKDEIQDGDVDQRPRQLYKALTAKYGKESDACIDESHLYRALDVKMHFVLDLYETQVNWGSWHWKGMHDKSASDRVPNTGWLWANSLSTKNVDYGHRRWGYVFWDRERLDNWNITAKDMVSKIQYWISQQYSTDNSKNQRAI